MRGVVAERPLTRLTHGAGRVSAWPAGSGWAVPGSNQRPPACKAGALPTELTARRRSVRDALVALRRLPEEVVGRVGHRSRRAGRARPAGTTPPDVFRRWTHVVFARRPPSEPSVVTTAWSRSDGMFPGAAGTTTIRAASTELPSFSFQTGRPVAKFRKCVPIAFGFPPRLLVEDRLRGGEQPGAVRLAGVLLHSARLDDEEEAAVRSGRPRVERIAGGGLRRRVRESSRDDEAEHRQDSGAGGQEARTGGHDCCEHGATPS